MTRSRHSRKRVSISRPLNAKRRLSRKRGGDSLLRVAKLELRIQKKKMMMHQKRVKLLKMIKRKRRIRRKRMKMRKQTKSRIKMNSLQRNLIPLTKKRTNSRNKKKLKNRVLKQKKSQMRLMIGKMLTLMTWQVKPRKSMTSSKLLIPKMMKTTNKF